MLTGPLLLTLCEDKSVILAVRVWGSVARVINTTNISTIITRLATHLKTLSLANNSLNGS
jgi:hypothetical protein